MTNQAKTSAAPKLAIPQRMASFAFLAVAALGFADLATAQESDGLQLVEAFDNAVAAAIEKAEPSVVAVARVAVDSETGEVARGEGRIGLFPGLGGTGFGQQPVRPTDPDFIPDEFATGVVVDEKGLVLTTYGAVKVDEPSEFYVTLGGGRVFRARLIATSSRYDMALLEAEDPSGKAEFKAITLGDASQLKKGQTVIALGNPYAVARDGQVSASRGIVANLHRKAPPAPDDESPNHERKDTLHHFGTLIQTDARLNLGTSGGALINLRGEMVGLTVSLAAVSGFEQSAGYAIPVDEGFRLVLGELKQGRPGKLGFLGIGPANLTPAEILEGRRGALINHVIVGTSAWQAGLQRGDVVTMVDGEPVHTADDLMRMVGSRPVAAVTTLTIERDGRPLEKKAQLTAFPERAKEVQTAAVSTWRGIQVDYPTALTEVIDPQSRAPRYDLSACVAVREVEYDSPAWKAGLRRAALVTHVGERPVHSPEEFEKLVAGAEGALTLTVTSSLGYSRSVEVPAE